MTPKIWNHKRAAPAPDMEAKRKIAPETMCTTLCAALTIKMPSNMSSLVTPGTNPRIPTARKTRPKSIPNDLAIAEPPIGFKRIRLWQPPWTLARKKALAPNGGARCLSKIDNMKSVLLLFAVGLVAAVNFSSGQSSPVATKTTVFAGGCFWCIQPAFDKAPGVIKTTVGYCGGIEPDPTYELVGSEKTKYRESIEIVYDPAKISYEQLLDIYWKQIDPTQSDGQFTDIGPSYRAAIFYDSDEEKKIVEVSKEKLAA